MSEHKATIEWNRNGEPFDVKSYPRNHSWSFDAGIKVNASASPAYRGDASCVDPEEAFVASLASCHMLWFLAIASKKGHTVDSYVDEAVGHLGRNEEGRTAITKVELRPRVTFAEGDAPDAGTLDEMHETAHKECFIANSVRCEVEVRAPAPAA